MGNRVLKAPTFDDLLGDVSDEVQCHPDLAKLSVNMCARDSRDLDPPFNDLQLGIASRILRRASEKHGKLADLESLWQRHASDVKTIGELSKALYHMLDLIEEKSESKD